MIHKEAEAGRPADAQSTIQKSGVPKIAGPRRLRGISERNLDMKHADSL